MKRYSVATSCMMESPRNSILWLWPLEEREEIKGRESKEMNVTPPTFIHTEAPCSLIYTVWPLGAAAALTDATTNQGWLFMRTYLEHSSKTARFQGTSEKNT